MSKKITTTATPMMSAKNLVTSPEKLESALAAIDTALSANLVTLGAFNCTPAGKASWYGAIGGTGSRFIDSAAFIAMLINAGFVRMTAAGRLERQLGKPTSMDLVNRLYYKRNGNDQDTKKTLFRPDGHGHYFTKGNATIPDMITDAGIIHFHNRLITDSTSGWSTDFKLVRQFRDLMAGKVETFDIDFVGSKITIKKGGQVSATCAKPSK
jgi:hypothetical protein